MALDRERIERKDFPSARQGYSRPEVDAHLKQLADELERSQSSQPTLASSASDRVRAIVEAAESSAAEIRAEAEQEAEGLRRDALADAHLHTERVTETAKTALAQLDAARRELETLIASLHDAAADVAPPPVASPTPLASSPPLASAAPVQPAPPEPEPVADEQPAPPEARDPAPVLALAAQPPALAASPQAAPDDDVAADPEAEGARLIALNMALDGSPREDTAKYLDEHFALANADALLDEVYARVGG